MTEPCRRCGSMAGYRFLDKSLCARCFNTRDKWEKTVKIIVPNEMISAAWNAVALKMREYVTEGKGRVPELSVSRISVEAALQWLAENPVVPTDEQEESLRNACFRVVGPTRFVRNVAVEWQRRMFLASEPEVPEEIKDLLVNPSNWVISTVMGTSVDSSIINSRVIEAFRRGRQDGPKSPSSAEDRDAAVSEVYCRGQQDRLNVEFPPRGK